METVRHLLDYDYIIQALMNKVSYENIAARESGRLSFQVSRNVIAGVHRDFKRGQLTVSKTAKAKHAVIPSLLERPTYSYGKEPEIAGGIPVFNGHMQLDKPAVMVWNDLHGTKLDTQLLGRTEDVRRYYNLKTLIIAGDLADNAALNKHKKRTMKFEVNLSLELRVLRDVLSFAAENYDEIFILPGNHDMWMVEAIEGTLQFSDALEMVVTSDNVRRKLRVSNYDRLTLKSGERVWTIAHQAAYSPTPLQVAQRLSEFFETDIYTTHQHISAGPIWSKNKKHLLMDVGGLFDPDKFDYSNLITTGRRAMGQGFATIIHGKPNLWTPDNLTTNWQLLA